MKSKRKIKLGLFGFGEVGQAFFDLLAENQKMILSRTGYAVGIEVLICRDLRRKREQELPPILVSNDPEKVLKNPEIDVVIEVTGNVAFARQVIQKAMEEGKPVITANKAVMATHYHQLMELSQALGVPLAFEACVGSGTPFVNLLSNGIAGEQVLSLTGILNSSTNIILEEMEKNDIDFNQALSRSQLKGFLEADASLDVDGWDTAYKLCLLANQVFEPGIRLEEVNVQGIRGLVPEDFKAAAQKGCRLKLIGHVALQTNGIVAWVRPEPVPVQHPLADVEAVENGLEVTGEINGNLFLKGRGAGGRSAGMGMISDLMNLLGAGKITPR